jgi:hypothetical protein
MYGVPQAGLTLPAVARRLERGVRPRCFATALVAHARHGTCGSGRGLKLMSERPDGVHELILATEGCGGKGLCVFLLARPQRGCGADTERLSPSLLGPGQATGSQCAAAC